jgi:DNA-binding transcriptional MocR family regulator
MSVQAITAALMAKGISPTEKLVLIVLSNYADADMKCWPSQKTLSRDTGLSSRSIVTLMASLEAKGLIERQARGRRAQGSRISDMTWLKLPEAASHSSPIHGANDRSSMVQMTTKLPEAASHKPSIEPLKKEPSSRMRAREAEAARMRSEEREEVGRMMKELAESLHRDRAIPKSRHRPKSTRDASSSPARIALTRPSS